MNQPKNDTKINLSVTIEELNIIFGGLEEVPHKFSRKVIDSLSQQAQPQVNAQQGPTGPLQDKVIQ